MLSHMMRLILQSITSYIGLHPILNGCSRFIFKF